MDGHIRTNIKCEMCGCERNVEKRRAYKNGRSLCNGCSNTNLDVLGKRFGSLTALSYAGKNKFNKTLVLARCDCGKEIVVIASHLRSGNTKSCGDSHITRVEKPKRIRVYVERPKHKLRIWSKQVKERDVYCVACGSSEDLMAHHLENYANNPELRFDVNNGVTLCRKCHVDFHCNFMGNYRIPCTKEDLDEYLLQV